MKKLQRVFLYSLPLILPFLIMIIVNEYVRAQNQQEFTFHGYSVLNPVHAEQNKCTWNCHNDTRYCMDHHVNWFSDDFRQKVDVIYFGIINLMFSTGVYGAANILFLVILWPAFMYFLLIRNIQLAFKIKSHKRYAS